MTTSCAAAASSGRPTNGMGMREVNVEMENLKKHFKYLKEGDCLRVDPPKEVMEEAEKKIITYKTLRIGSKKIEIAETEVIEKCLKEITEEVVLFMRGKKYETVKVYFKTEQGAKKYSTMPLRTDEWPLLPVYCGRRAARVRIGRLPLEIDMEWLVSVVIYKCKDKVHIIKVERSREIEWWGLGVEFLAHITLPDRHNIAEELVLLRIVVEGRQSVCYKCRSRGHMQAVCPRREIIVEEDEVEETEVCEEEMVQTEQEEVEEKQEETEEHGEKKRMRTESPPKSPKRKKEKEKKMTEDGNDSEEQNVTKIETQDTKQEKQLTRQERWLKWWTVMVEQKEKAKAEGRIIGKVDF
uniref:CCHC-type domain-containing protein n=1 Tax=Octopus bimaculoides TaxID=37653 RepID=A0A0L8HDN2_OCTBM